MRTITFQDNFTEQTHSLTSTALRPEKKAPEAQSTHQSLSITIVFLSELLGKPYLLSILLHTLAGAE